MQIDFLRIWKSMKNLFKIDMIKKKIEKLYFSIWSNFDKNKNKMSSKKKIKKTKLIKQKKKFIEIKKICRRRQMIKCKCNAQSQTNCTKWKNSFQKKNY